MKDMKNIEFFEDVSALQLGSRPFYSANHDEIMAGYTTDVYFVKTRDLLRENGTLDVPVVAEIFSKEAGVFAGLSEVLSLLRGKGVEVYSLDEGMSFSPKEVVCRIHGLYSAFGMYETVILGFLAASSGWATAARECVRAANGRPVLCFGARHVHPAVAPVMERVALDAGGCAGASCILGAKMAKAEPQGTIPHAAVLIVGDTVKTALLYNSILPERESRIILVDTFKDEAEESLLVARALKKDLHGVRLDTPGERGGVSPALVREVRWRLDVEGFNHVKIVVSGGLNPERIKLLLHAGADVFGVGSYIAHGTPRDMTMDLKMIDGKPIAKRGRLPGIEDNPRLRRFL
ncbi:quinolinate phosphoribosyl transferase protein [Acetomicrobium hydrogeniformans ATCC BAA-1850]|uniref:Quinolinate phosphoribosyl transferase protein n=2 Tax=Acetomicrobium hydrogeniformans TaxID=649746 RepID=A0A0T5X984_9BACT|nr:quinolinate phosphoribosyl transferase protein [Acetomicrobium hydrogeniformans ATCC BAA-1850]